MIKFDHPLLQDFPYSIRTDRLVIRGPLPGDGREIHQAVVDSAEALKPWMPWALDIPDAEAYEIRAREGQLKFLGREDLWMLIFLKGTQTMVGSTGLHRIDWNVPKFEIGYWVRTGHGGNGYITEAVVGLVNYAFHDLGGARVEIRCDVNNERSAAIPRRLNFTHEGVIRRDSRHHLTGELRDTHIFARYESFLTEELRASSAERRAAQAKSADEG